MSRLLGRLLRRAAPETPIDYEAAKAMARADDVAARRVLAARADTRPEILYFLADDCAPEVRREIAANDATPVQADLVRARDADDSVRLRIAAKISALAPGLDERTKAHIGGVVSEI